MQITRQADYAIRAVLYLAQLEAGGRTSTAQIAREQKIPPTFLAKIIAQLSVAGIVHATRGAHGGVTLARPADEISLLEIVETIDGPVLLNECVADPQVCPMSDGCPIQKVWCEAQTELIARLAETKFGQLALASESPALPGLISR
jgi:Rrf2 family protein